ncbi:MAG: immunoglobulin domain-containing protein [Verrucomicrobiota bacterium]
MTSPVRFFLSQAFPSLLLRGLAVALGLAASITPHLAQAATATNSAPRFTTQPTSRTVSVASTVSLSVVFSGTPTPTIEWFKNGSLYSGTGTTSATSTSANLTITNVQAVEAGTYVAVATNSFSGTRNTVTSSPAFLTVSTAIPINNNFASATTLSGTTMSVSATNVGATKETREPKHANNAGGKSVWWTWTPTASGTVSISTANSSFDTLLGVYTGTTVSALTTIASNDDVATGSHSSLVSFAANAGTAYRIAVDGFSGTSGTISLSLSLVVAPPLPANDNFASAFTLSGTTATASGTNVGATKQAGEPKHAGNAGGASVWWSWTATGSGTVTISTARSSFDTILGVYTGATVTGLTAVASNDDVATGSHSSLVSFPAQNDTTYRIAVDGFGGATGTVSLALSQAVVTVPSNNAFASAIALSSSATVTTSGSNVGATKETGEPSHAGNGGGKSVWWTWTPTASGTVSISTASSSFDTLLGVYTGTTVSALTTIASNDDVATGSHSSLVSFAANAGTLYRIAVDGFAGTSGTISLAINLTPTPPPANDNFASRIVLQGRTVTTSGTNINATKETGEPNHAGNAGGASVWWSWTASGSGTVTVSTAGGKFTPLVGIYTGTTTVSALTRVASTSSGLVTFSATLGTAYQIAVDGPGGVTGGIKLSISGPPVAPAPDAIPSGLTLVYKPTATGSSGTKASSGSAVTLTVNSPKGGVKAPLGSVTIVAYEATSLQDVAWNGSLYIAVGNAGTILTSTDGLSWVPRNSGTAANLLAVVWDGAQWVVVGTLPATGTSGESPSITLISPDGVNWSVSGP